jgi:hypothetical protein
MEEFEDDRPRSNPRRSQSRGNQSAQRNLTVASAAESNVLASPAAPEEERKEEKQDDGAGEDEKHANPAADPNPDPNPLPDQPPEDNEYSLGKWRRLLQSGDGEDLLGYARAMIRSWGGGPAGQVVSHGAIATLAHARYPWTRIDFIRAQRDIYSSKFYLLIQQLSTVNEDGRWPHEIRGGLNVVRERIELLYRMQVSAARVVQSFQPAFMDPAFTFLQHAFWLPVGTEDASEHIQALLCVMQRTNELQLRHRDDKVFRPVRAADGQFLHAYEPHCTDASEKYDITAMLHWLAQNPATSGEFAHLYRSGQTTQRLTAALTDINNVAFPRLTTSPVHTSYNNGVYNADDDTFSTYAALPADYATISCLLINKNFELFDHLRGDFSTGSWFRIAEQCPNFMTILNTQLPEKSPQRPDGYTEVELIKRFFCAFLGRALYPVGRKDNQHKAFVIVGEGGTGKSLLLDTLAALRAPDDVETISNEMETTFGLDPIADKLLVTMSEMDSGCKLSQSDFNSMVVGERMSIRGKYRKAYTIKAFKAQLVITTNSFAKWMDKRGNLVRRLIVANFKQAVARINTQLKERVMEELPKIHVLFIRGYLSMLREMAAKGVSHVADFWHEYFSQCSQELFADQNPLIHFLANGPLVFGAGCYMPMEFLQKLLREHCQRHGMHMPAVTESTWKQPFQQKNLRIERTRQYYPRHDGDSHPDYSRRRRMQATFVVGVDFDYTSTSHADDSKDDGGAGLGLGALDLGSASAAERRRREEEEEQRLFEDEAAMRDDIIREREQEDLKNAGRREREREEREQELKQRQHQELRSLFRSTVGKSLSKFDRYVDVAANKLLKSVAECTSFRTELEAHEAKLRDPRHDLHSLSGQAEGQQLRDRVQRLVSLIDAATAAASASASASSIV